MIKPYNFYTLKRLRQALSLNLIGILFLLNLSFFSIAVMADTSSSSKNNEQSIRNSQETCEIETAQWYAYDSTFHDNNNPFSKHQLYNDQALNINFSVSKSNMNLKYLSDDQQARITESIEVPGCCYSNENEQPFDMNLNCELEDNEKCNLNKHNNTITDNEKCRTARYNPDSATEVELAACYREWTCNGNSPNPEPSSNDPNQFTAHSSEYFSINDAEKGLVTDGQGDSFYNDGGTGQGPIFTAFNQLTNIMVGLASTAALVILIIGAFLLVTSNGEENKIEKGKNSIKFALLGLVFVLLSYTIVKLVQSILF